MLENFDTELTKLTKFLNTRKVTNLSLPSEYAKCVQFTNINKETILILSTLLFNAQRRPRSNDLETLVNDKDGKLIYYWGINPVLGATLLAYVDKNRRVILKLIYATNESMVNLCLETTRHEYGLSYLLALEEKENA